MTNKMLALLGITMIGEGVAAMIRPRGYLQIWAWPNGPEWYVRSVQALRQRPTATIGIAAIETVVGLGLVWAAERA